MPAVPPETQTLNYGWIKPYPTGSVSTWGATLNVDLDQIDAQLFAVANPNFASVFSIPSTSVKGTLAFLNHDAPSGQQIRWALVEDTTFEAGANAGSNLALVSYNDSGAQLATPMMFNRATAAVTFSGGMVGVTNGSDAGAGQVGEFLSILISTPVSMASGLAKNVGSLSLTAGDWDVFGWVLFAAAASTVTVNVAGGLSLVSNTLPTAASGLFSTALWTQQAVNLQHDVAVPCGRVSISSPTTLYLVAGSSFSNSTLTTIGYIGARRAR